MFQTDPHNPDPGRVTVRRLNRVEYRNTVRDLMGVDFNTEKEFPADDTGHGFDNIGDVLTLSPMLLEKYLAAAKTVVTKAVPAVPGAGGEDDRGPEFQRRVGAVQLGRIAIQWRRNALSLSYYERGGRFEHVQGRARRTLSTAPGLHGERAVRGQSVRLQQMPARLQSGRPGTAHARNTRAKAARRSTTSSIRTGRRASTNWSFELQPLTPDQKQVRSLTLRTGLRDGARAVGGEVLGPAEELRTVLHQGRAEECFRPPQICARDSGAFCAKSLPASGRCEDGGSAGGAGRNHLHQKGKTFEAGIGQAMVAVLASPRFLFREESAEPAGGKTHPFVDEYALASRLSYFFWSSMPDDELLRLAGEKKLRANLDAQLKRMLADPKSEAFVRNFVGQWLQTRDIETVSIDARQVLNRECRKRRPPAVDPDREKRMQRFRELRDKEETNEASLTPEEKKELEEVHDGLFGPQAQPAVPPKPIKSDAASVASAISGRARN